ncbi:MAG: acetoacetate--CoA ligase [Phycisphaerae bacterium]
MLDTAPLWSPDPAAVKNTQMFAFMARIAQKYGIAQDWEALREWSIGSHPRDAGVTSCELFWQEFADFAGIKFSTPPTKIRAGDGMLEAKWFVGGKINYARHMLRFDDDNPAIIFRSEIGKTTTISHRELRITVAKAAASLRKLGVEQGDRVAGFMPNIPETLIMMLATTSLGAIWSSCSPDFGVKGVLDRFGQIDPVVLIAPDGYTYSGKPFDTRERVREIQSSLRSLKQTVLVPYLNVSPDLSAMPNTVSWSDFLVSGGENPLLEFAEVPFDHPLFIMYSSGTTGVPKCIVHGHGGTLLQHMKELILHCDLRAGDRAFYFTTCGWMMWNWLVSALGTGATVMLFDGNPAHPTVHTLWEFAAEQKITLFGTSPKFLSACQKSHIEPGKSHDLSALRVICSTGAPLTAEQFEWVYANVKRDVQLSSISGGTDIISCFMLGNPLLPVYAGEIQCRGLGMDVQAWDENGQPVIGEKGELVCATAFPSQPVGFWNDPDQSKYKAAYFDHYPGIWRHGDFVEITERGGIVVYGRSDATLNPGGVRIGTAEIYRIVEEVPEVMDSLVIGRTVADDVEIVLFVVLREGYKLSDGSGLKEKIRSAIIAGASRRHLPRHIIQVSAIPYTISGKKVELAVQNIVEGKEVKNRDALANPAALEEYAGMKW